MPEPESNSPAAAATEPAKHRRSARQQKPRYLDNALTGNEVLDLLDEFIADEGGTRARKRRKQKKAAPRNGTSHLAKHENHADSTNAPPAENNTDQILKKAPAPERPRWYNQMYVMFLALRQSPGYTASRSELVRKAVELDKKISQERNLPRAFTGKTPQNSASALLTNNFDRYFVQFRPEGAKCYHFKLAYKPGDLESALAAYNEWMDILINKDWPICFGPEPKDEGESPQTAAPASTAATTSTSADTTATDVPKSWRDIVTVQKSRIPNAGNGLFAVHDLPAGTPLGFYFGVPMTEDEFDSLKDNVGVASHYSIMYRKTVLDATDENGAPYSDPNGRVYCPFHFMNEDTDEKNCNIAFLEGAAVNQVICLASRNIKVGEELLVFYGDEVDRSHWKPRDIPAATDTSKAPDGSQDPSCSPTASSSPIASGTSQLSAPSPSRNWGIRATPAAAPTGMSAKSKTRHLMTFGTPVDVATDNKPHLHPNTTPL
ncbi:hypothetical protein GGI12_000274 [Dipsacomyces acuminosporus]|nr:hypothetical protein GGI12_000274 [Dipsacomyces acuminosporus]